MKKKIYLCAINNIESGSCNEDCKFCTQSVRHGADISRYSRKGIETILIEAQKAVSAGAIGYCLVSAGKGLSDSMTEYVAKVASTIKQRFPSLHIIACNGTADKAQLKQLKDSGVSSYNHNLETSREYYPQICTTHSWDERYATCEAVKSVGLMLCTGGIFGMGESEADRDSLIDSIISLKPEASPLNFFIPNPALPIKERNIDTDTALEMISRVRRGLGDEAIVMVAGGREILFSGREDEMFGAGADSIVIGDYLTVSGNAPDSDLSLLQKLGYRPADICDE